MPARDGSGPQGQGARTGRGMGRCNPVADQTYQPTLNRWNRPSNQLGWMWRNSIGRLFARRRGNRINWR
jgi:hypothetical protein